jgi:hypothetical protein
VRCSQYGLLCVRDWILLPAHRSVPLRR